MPDLQLVTFPHPVLRHRSKPIMRVDAELQSIVSQMFKIMYTAKGVGLAANQVGLPIRLFVANPTGKADEGKEMVFINPVISKQKGVEEAEEGCLSLPGVNANVKRSKSLWVNAYDIAGKEIDTEMTGFLARIIQHETDHLDGVLFVDRLQVEAVKSVEPSLANLIYDFESRQKMGAFPSDAQLMEGVSAWEKRYC